MNSTSKQFKKRRREQSFSYFSFEKFTVDDCESLKKKNEQNVQQTVMKKKMVAVNDHYLDYSTEIFSSLLLFPLSLYKP